MTMRSFPGSSPARPILRTPAHQHGSRGNPTDLKALVDPLLYCYIWRRTLRVLPPEIACGAAMANL